MIPKFTISIFCYQQVYHNYIYINLLNMQYTQLVQQKVQSPEEQKSKQIEQKEQPIEQKEKPIQQQEQQIVEKEKIYSQDQHSQQNMIEKSEGHISQNTFDMLQSQQSIKQTDVPKSEWTKQQQQVLNQYSKIIYSHAENRELVVTDPSEKLLYSINSFWNLRPIVSPQNKFTLKVIYPKKQGMNQEQYRLYIKQKEQYLRNYFDASATINLFINQDEIKGRKGKIETQGQGKTIKEGTSEFKLIYYTENATRYIGTVKQIQEIDEDGKVRLIHKYDGSGRLWQNSNNKKQSCHYDGQFKNGKRQGYGAQQSSNMSSYRGYWKNNLKDGQGQELILMKKKRKKGQTTKKQIIRKSHYKGQFKQNMRHGKGSERTPFGFYEGDWYQGLKHGEGKMQYHEGSKYEGSWEDNYYHGKGKFLDSNKNQYQGQFQGGKYNGFGTMKYSSGDTYEGEWENDVQHGSGLYTWQDGDYYDGQWKKGFAEGNGTQYLSGVIYIGEFQAGKKHGQGQKTDEQGNVTRGIWHMNKLKRKLAVNEQDIPQADQSCSEQD